MNGVLVVGLGFPIIEIRVFVDPLSFWELEHNGANLPKLHTVDTEDGEFYLRNGWYRNDYVCYMDD